MNISLNGISWNHSLSWENEFDFSEVSQSVKRTILGKIVIHSMPKEKGREIVISSEVSGSSYSGYWTREQVSAVKALERTVTQVPFVYGSFSANVVVKSNGVSVSPLNRGSDQDTDDLYIGSITLIEV